MKICLVGSTRFMSLYREINRKLTLAGHVVYTVAQISSSSTDEDVKIERQENPISQADKETLDLVHLFKILESQAVFLVTDSTGYFGESTRRELKWASMLGRPIFHPDDLPEVTQDGNVTIPKIGAEFYR